MSAAQAVAAMITMDNPAMTRRKGTFRVEPAARATILTPMGMDPTRPHRRRPTDYVFVGAGLLVMALLVLWALSG